MFQQWPYSQILAPVAGFLVVGIFILLLKWAFSRGHSVVNHSGQPGRDDDYGLLIPVSAPISYVEAEIIRRELESVGIRAKAVTTLDGPRVMVFAGDERRARTALGR